jgi:replicative DNA helicase
MASAEHLLISKVLKDRSLNEAISSYGVTTEQFSGDYGDQWVWINRYYVDHGEVPSERAFLSAFPSVTLAIVDTEVLSGLADEVRTSHLISSTTGVLAEATLMLDQGQDDPMQAINYMYAAVQNIMGGASITRDINIVETWKERLEDYAYYREHQDELLGIPTGFPGLDALTSGLRPQQLVTLVGEAKRGKSMMAMVMAVTANDTGVTPMMVSFEMGAKEMAARHDAYVAKVSHGGLLHGTSTSEEVSRLQIALRMRKNSNPFVIVEDTSSAMTVGGLAAKIEQHDPGIVIVDGAYMMTDENGESPGSPQALTNITRSLKRLAQRADVPIVITTQVLSSKLTSRTSRRVTADAIGYSSSFVQDSDLVMAVERDPDHEERSIVRIVESRTSPRGEVTIKWDWDTMNFSEVDTSKDDDINNDDEDNDDFNKAW